MNFFVFLFFSAVNCVVLPLLESYHPRDLKESSEDSEYAANRLLRIIDMLTFRYSHARSMNFESQSVKDKVYNRQRLKTLNIFHKGARFKRITPSEDFVPLFQVRDTIALYSVCYQREQQDCCEMVGLPYPGGCDRPLVQKFLLHAPKMDTILRIQMEVIQEPLTPILPLPTPILATSPFFYDFVGLPKYDPGYTEWPGISVLKALALHAKRRYRPFTLKMFERFLLERIYPGSRTVKLGVNCLNTGTSIRILRLCKQSVDVIYPGEAIFDYARLIKFKGWILPGPLQSYADSCPLDQSSRLLLLHSLEEFREYDPVELCSHISVIILPSTLTPPIVTEGNHLVRIHFPCDQDDVYNRKAALHNYFNRVHVPFEPAVQVLNSTTRSTTELVDIIHSYAYKDEEQDEVFNAVIEATAVAVYDQGIIYSTSGNTTYKQDFDNDPRLLLVPDSSAKVRCLSVSGDGGIAVITYDCDVVTIYNDTTKVCNNFAAYQGLVSADGRITIFQVNVVDKAAQQVLQGLGLAFAFSGGLVSVFGCSASLALLAFVGSLGMMYLSHSLGRAAVIIRKDGKQLEPLVDCTLLHATRSFDRIYLQRNDADFQISLRDGECRTTSTRTGQDLTHLLSLEPNASLTEILSNLEGGQHGSCLGSKSHWYSTFLESMCGHEDDVESSDLFKVRRDKSRVVLIKSESGKKHVRILQPVPSRALLARLIFPCQ